MALISQLQPYQSNYLQLECNSIARESPKGFPSSSSLLGLNVERRPRSLGQRMVVSASPPTEDAVVMTQPLTKQDLVAYLASGCKTKEKWRIGTEHEKFGFEFGTLRPMKYEQIADVLNGLAERFDWEKILEGDYVIGLKQVQPNIFLNFEDLEHCFYALTKFEEVIFSDKSFSYPGAFQLQDNQGIVPVN